MSLKSRLDRLEKAAEAIRPDPNTCPTCGAPMPSLPRVIQLGADGSIRAAAMPGFDWEQCDDCGGIGGRSALRLDPETGALEGKLIILPDPENHDDLSLEDWLDRYDGRPLGRPWDEWLRLCQRVR